MLSIIRYFTRQEVFNLARLHSRGGCFIQKSKRYLHIIFPITESSNNIHVLNYGVETWPQAISLCDLSLELLQCNYHTLITKIFDKQAKSLKPYIYRLDVRLDGLTSNLEYRTISYMQSLPKILPTMQIQEIINFIDSKFIGILNNSQNIICYVELRKYYKGRISRLTFMLACEHPHISIEIFNNYIWAKIKYRFKEIQISEKNFLWDFGTIREYYIQNSALVNDEYFSQHSVFNNFNDIVYEHEYDFLNAYLQLDFLIHWCKLTKPLAIEFLIEQENYVLAMIKRFRKLYKDTNGTWD